MFGSRHGVEITFLCSLIVGECIGGVLLSLETGGFLWMGREYFPMYHFLEVMAGY